MLQNFGSAGEALDLPGVTASGVEAGADVAQFELALNLAESETGLSGALSFARQLFDEASAQRIAARYVRLIEAVVAAPQAPLEALPLIGDDERQLLAAWNATALHVPQSATLAGLLAQSVAAHGGETAAIGVDGTALCYAELDRRTTALAHGLMARGIGPESVVGVRLERSLETLVAFLAIVKAGGVYLPLDPAYPGERLDHMIADAQAALVIDSVALLDAIEAEGAALESVALPAIAPENLAYIIYTSGTTGQPKGVGVPHGALVNLAFARAGLHDDLAPGDRVLASTSIGSTCRSANCCSRCCAAHASSSPATCAPSRPALFGRRWRRSASPRSISCPPSWRRCWPAPRRLRPRA